MRIILITALLVAVLAATVVSSQKARPKRIHIVIIRVRRPVIRRGRRDLTDLNVQDNANSQSNYNLIGTHLKSNYRDVIDGDIIEGDIIDGDVIDGDEEIDL